MMTTTIVAMLLVALSSSSSYGLALFAWKDVFVQSKFQIHKEKATMLVLKICSSIIKVSKYIFTIPNHSFSTSSGK